MAKWKFAARVAAARERLENLWESGGGQGRCMDALFLLQLAEASGAALLRMDGKFDSLGFDGFLGLLDAERLSRLEPSCDLSREALFGVRNILRYFGGGETGAEERMAAARDMVLGKAGAGVNLYVDGSCIADPEKPNNSGPGGWAWLREESGKIVSRSGGCRLTHSSRMEFMAAVEGLLAIEGAKDVNLHTDFETLAKLFAKREIAPGHKISDLLAMLLQAAEPHNVNVVLVKGHSAECPNHAVCDQMAREQAKNSPSLPDRMYEHWLAHL